MKNLRKAARGRECTVRLPGICNHNSETTVLAHLRRAGIAGMGQKPVDLCAVRACSSCHDAIDGRANARLYDYDGMILDALCRTLDQYVKEYGEPWA